MLKKRFIPAAILMLVLIVATIACAAPATTPASATTPKPAPTTTVAPAPVTTPKPAPATTAAPAPTTGPQTGGTIKIIASPGVQNIGYPGKPFFPGDQGIGRCAYQYILNKNEKGEVVGELATDFKFSSDYKTLTLTLRKGVKFHDGTDFNADAAIYNLNLHWKGIRSDLQSVTSMDKVDDYTIRLNLKGYDASIFEGLQSLSGYIVSPTSLKTLGDEAMLKPVGTGPFKFVSYQRDISMKFTRFDGYWEKGKPYVDNIEWVFIKDPVTQLASFKAGEAQVMRGIDTASALDLQAGGKFNMIKYPTQVRGITGDGGHPDSIFANIKVRQAIAYAIDNAAIAKALGRGFFQPATQWANPDAGGLTYNPAIVGYKYDPLKARQLLTEAGYPTGFETKILLQSTFPQPDMMTMVQAYLQEIGIRAKLDVADTGRFNEIAVKGWNNHLIYYWMSAAKGIDPASSIRSKMTKLASHYDPKSVYIPDSFHDKYMEAASQPDPVKKVELFKEVGRLAVDTYCIGIPIYVHYDFRPTVKEVNDFDMYLYGVNEWRPENAWLSKK